MWKDPIWKIVPLNWDKIPDDMIEIAEKAHAERWIEIMEKDDGLYWRRWIDDWLLELGL